MKTLTLSDSTQSCPTAGTYGSHLNSLTGSEPRNRLKAFALHDAKQNPFRRFLSSARMMVLLLLMSLLGAVTTQSYGAIAQRGSTTTGNTTGGTLTINKPTGVVTGDVMIVNIAVYGSRNTLGNPTSSGWTLIDGDDVGGNNYRYGATLYKIAGAGDASTTSYNFILAGDGRDVDASVGAIIAFSGVDVTGGVLPNGTSGGPFDLATGASTLDNSSTVTDGTITTVTANAAVIMLGQAVGAGRTWGTWSTTSPGTLTEIIDNQSSITSIGAAWAIKSSISATGSGTVNLSGSDQNAGILIALRPIPPPPPTVSSTFSPTSACYGSLLN